MRTNELNQVHDEVVLDCPKDEVEVARKLVESVMVGVGERSMRLTVPLTVNSGVGQTWLDL